MSAEARKGQEKNMWCRTAKVGGIKISVKTHKGKVVLLGDVVVEGIIEIKR